MDYTVYKHTCPNGKVYIGQTKQPIKKRWGGGSNYKHNIHFYRAIKKYGWDNIVHEILDENLDFKEANEKEVYYIKLLNSYDCNFGYNITLGGDGTKGKKLTDDRKKAIGDFFRGKKLSDDHRKKMSIARTDNNKIKGRTGSKCKLSKKIKQIDKDTLEVLKIWDSVRDVQRDLGLCSGSISKICNKKVKCYTCGGYRWEYCDN